MKKQNKPLKDITNFKLPPDSVGKFEVNTAARLKEKFRALSDDFIERIVSDSAMSSAVEGLLECTPESFSEEDPLILILAIIGDQNSTDYIRGGNYNIPVGVPGHQPWPVAGAGVIPPAAALGTFLSLQPGVEGNLFLF
jgi:hypothetical protein